MLESILSADRLLCVDFFEDPSGAYGFEHLRADPEDGGTWQAIGGFGAARFSSALDAARAAGEAVGWLSEDHHAGGRYLDYRAELLKR